MHRARIIKIVKRFAENNKHSLTDLVVCGDAALVLQDKLLRCDEIHIYPSTTLWASYKAEHLLSRLTIENIGICYAKKVSNNINLVHPIHALPSNSVVMVDNVYILVLH